MTRQSTVITAAAVLIATMALTGPREASATAPVDRSWHWSGDARGGLFVSERRVEGETVGRSEDLRWRLRLSARRSLAERLEFRARVAGTWSLDEPGTRAYLRASSPSATGANAGDVTFDELQLRVRGADNTWWLVAGRFQNRFLLPGVAAKSLDRNDGSNVGVAWRDGLHYSHRLNEAWRAHVVVTHRPRDGGGSARRAPLDFMHTDHRASVFTGLASERAEGPIIMRMVGIDWLPDALASDQADPSRREDYVALVARAAAQWPLGAHGTRLLAGAEIGYAPRTQRLPGAAGMTGGRASGLAWQASVNLYDIRPGHHLGLVHGQAGAGWLLSNDFRANDRLTELRYQRRFSPALSVEIRGRYRDTLVPAPGQPRRHDRDAYARITLRF